MVFQIPAIRLIFSGYSHIRVNAKFKFILEAALQGHELGEWEQVDETGHEWEARCRVCGRTTFVSETVRYSVLGERCLKEGEMS